MSTAPHHARPLRARLARRVRLAAALLSGLACAPGTPPAPDAGWPEGALLSARRAPLARLLAQLRTLEDTPLARLADALERRLPACETLEARAADAAGLADALRCADPAGALAELHAHRAASGLLLALPVGEGPRLLLRGEAQDAALRFDLRWPGAAADGALAGLLPGADAAGPPLFTADERILHARAKSPGLDLEALAPAGSQGDQLFRLRSGLLSRAVLDGSWELALYAPAPQGRMPRVALALGVRLRAAAERAVSRLLDELEAAWSLRRAPLALPGGRALCLPELRLMPELAPCALVGERAVVLAWNAASLRWALGGDAPARPFAEPARVELDLVRLQQADLRLAASHGAAAIARVARWPWQRALARGGRRAGVLELRVELGPADGAGT